MPIYAVLKKSLVCVFVAAVLLYLGDWVVFEVRRRQNTAFGTERVQSFLTTPLKGNKAEYDYLGPIDQPCARAIFPHTLPACWWVRRHRDHWE